MPMSFTLLTRPIPNAATLEERVTLSSYHEDEMRCKEMTPTTPSHGLHSSTELLSTVDTNDSFHHDHIPELTIAVY